MHTTLRKNIFYDVESLGKKLRELLYANDMSMEQVNLAIERENVQETIDLSSLFPWHLQTL